MEAEDASEAVLFIVIIAYNRGEGLCVGKVARR